MEEQEDEALSGRSGSKQAGKKGDRRNMMRLRLDQLEGGDEIRPNTELMTQSDAHCFQTEQIAEEPDIT